MLYIIIVGSKFNNEVIERLFTLTGCRHKNSSPYHPQTNGIIILNKLIFSGWSRVDPLIGWVVGCTPNLFLPIVQLENIWMSK